MKTVNVQKLLIIGLTCTTLLGAVAYINKDGDNTDTYKYTYEDKESHKKPELPNFSKDDPVNEYKSPEGNTKVEENAAEGSPAKKYEGKVPHPDFNNEDKNNSNPPGFEDKNFYDNGGNGLETPPYYPDYKDNNNPNYPGNGNWNNPYSPGYGGEYAPNYPNFGEQTPPNYPSYDDNYYPGQGNPLDKLPTDNL